MSYSNEDLEKIASSMGVTPGNHIPDGGFDYDPEHDCITLDSVRVEDSAGKASEKYTSLLIPKTFPTSDGVDVFGKLSDIQAVYEREGWMVPSMALTSSIITRLICQAGQKMDLGDGWHIKDPDLFDLLKDKEFPFNPENIAVTNTLVDYKNGWIIHYPLPYEVNLADSGEYTSTKDNALTLPRRRSYQFDPEAMEDYIYGTIGDGSELRFLEDMTGGKSFKPIHTAKFYGRDKYQTYFWNDNVITAALASYAMTENTLVQMNTVGADYRARIPLVKVIEE